ncbi:MAG: hypothetical protein ACI8ZM_001151 [Crocinitomix sp.]|jgi:hypothetical protein
MKKIVLLFAFLPLLMTSCGGSETTEGPDGTDSLNTTTLDFSDMNEISLVPHGLNMKMMLPSVASSTGASIDAKIIHDEGDYLWSITIGPRFELIIEDFGKEMNKVTEEKKRLTELVNIFDVEYLVDEPALFMYKRTLHEGQGGKASYHCFGEVIIDGYNYVMRSNDEGALKPIIEDMVMTIRSAKPVSEV